MRLKLIETLELPAEMSAEDWYDLWLERVESMQKRFPILRVTKRDGSVLLAAHANVRGGTCNCCDKFSYQQEVARIEGFEIVPDDLVLDRLKLARSWLSYSDGVTDEMLAQLDEAIPKG
jgi:hypothetical protein